MNHILRSYYEATDGTLFRNSWCGLKTPPELGSGDILPLIEVGRRKTTHDETVCPSCLEAATQHEAEECDDVGTQLVEDEMFPHERYPMWWLLVTWLVFVILIGLAVAFMAGMLTGCSTHSDWPSADLFPAGSYVFDEPS